MYGSVIYHGDHLNRRPNVPGCNALLALLRWSTVDSLNLREGLGREANLSQDRDEKSRLGFDIAIDVIGEVDSHAFLQITVGLRFGRIRSKMITDRQVIGECGAR